MFTCDESSRIKQEFWTTFGRYMSPIFSAEGMKTNWVNYHTRLKDVHFRMDAGQKSVAIYISMEHAELDVQEFYFARFLQSKNLLHAVLKEEWEWQLRVTVANGKIISRIYKEITGVSVLNKDHWPDLISFFKPRIIALDSFWTDAQYSFAGLKVTPNLVR